MSTLPRVPNIPTVLNQRDGDAAVRSLLEYLGRLVIQLEPLVRLAPLAAGEIAQGTPGAGKYPDGGTDPATWTALPSPGKRIIQHVSGTAAGSSTTSTSFVDVTGATLTITPTSTSNKVLVLFSGHQFYVGNAGDQSQCILLAAGAQVTNSLRVQNSSGTGFNVQGGAAWTPLHAPATLSAVTYKIQQRVVTPSGAGGIAGLDNLFMFLAEVEP